MNTKNNARSKASRQALRTALLSLLEHQELDQINTAQLCRRAGVNRSTFYAHYDNLHQLLEELEEEMDATLLSRFQWVRDLESAMLDQRSVQALVEEIARYPAFYRARLNNASLQAGRYQAGMAWLTDTVLLPYARARSGNHPLLPFYMEFYGAGIFRILTLWLEENCQTPTDQISGLIWSLCMEPFLLADQT